MNRAERRAKKAQDRRDGRRYERNGVFPWLFDKDPFGAPLAIGYLPDVGMNDQASCMTGIEQWTNVALGEHSPADVVCFGYPVKTVDLDGLALELLPRARTIEALIARGYHEQAANLDKLGGNLSIPFVVRGPKSHWLGVLDVYPLAKGGTA